MSAPPPDGLPKSVVAERITIVDKEGNPRIVLGFDGAGAPEILLIDRRGAAVVHLGIARCGEPACCGGDAPGEAVLRLGAVDSGGQILAHAGSQGDAFLELTSAAENGASLLAEVDDSGGSRVVRLVLHDSASKVALAICDGKVEHREGRL